jgi:hypothetical protein
MFPASLGNAVKPNKTLKEAHEIVWYNNPDDKMPLPLQHPVSNPGEAVNPNGTLKEAHQIE